MSNVHRVAVPIQSQGDDRRRRRSDDGWNGHVVGPVVPVAVDTDRLPAPEDARAATENGIRDLALGGFVCSRRCSDSAVLILRLAWPRAGLEDHCRSFIRSVAEESSATPIRINRFPCTASAVSYLARFIYSRVLYRPILWREWREYLSSFRFQRWFVNREIREFRWKDGLSIIYRAEISIRMIRWSLLITENRRIQMVTWLSSKFWDSLLRVLLSIT